MLFKKKNKDKKYKVKKIYVDIAYCQIIELEYEKLHTLRAGPGAWIQPMYLACKHK